MDSCFYIQASSIPNSGEGLYASETICKGRFFHIATCSEPRLEATNDDETEILDWYVPVDIDMSTKAIAGDRVIPLKEIECSRSCFDKKYVHVSRSNTFMKANDLAWRPDVYKDPFGNYDSSKNKMELILGFEAGVIKSVYAYVNAKIRKDEEVGITYGVQYWNELD